LDALTVTPKEYPMEKKLAAQWGWKMAEMTGNLLVVSLAKMSDYSMVEM
jgi:hypothetical protein